MNAVFIIGGLVGLIVLILIIGAPVKLMKWMGNYGVKVVIGVLLLFFFNVFGGSFGLHIPINLFTVAVSGFLGVYGVISLGAVIFLLL